MALKEKQIAECADRLAQIGARRNEPMRDHTSFRIGGAADIFAVPKNDDELLSALNTAAELEIPVFCMGNGSNLLVSDDGIEGLVISLISRDCDVSFEGVNMSAGAWSLFSTVVKRSVEAGFTGLEWGAGIPGTVGGACAMNAGAYGGEVKNCLVNVDAIVKNENGYEKKTFAVQPDDLGYRRSKFAFPGMIVTRATFLLAPDDCGARERMADYTHRRTTKQPLSLPSAGSVFKRPEGHFAGALIESAGLKGACVGRAQVSELHAGFIVNTGGATARDVKKLIELIQKRVYDMSGVMLETEIKQIGR